MSNISDVDLITPGSVWLRESGKQSKVVCITNTSLPAKLSAAHPQQVVYIDDEGNFLNVGIEQFLAKRTFYNVDPDFEDRVNNLAVFSDTSANEQEVEALLNPDGDGDDDSLLLVVDDGDDNGEESPEDFGGEGEEQNHTDDSDADYDSAPFGNLSFVTFNVADDSALPVAIEPDVLANATVDYNQSALLDGSIEHTLLIDARIVSYDDLRACFSPSKVATHAIFTFDIDFGRLGGKDSAPFAVDWDNFMGIVPVVRGCLPYHKVIFTTNPAASAVRQVLHADIGEATPEKLAAKVEQFQNAEIPVTPTPVQVAVNKPAVINIKPIAPGEPAAATLGAPTSAGA